MHLGTWDAKVTIPSRLWPSFIYWRRKRKKEKNYPNPNAISQDSCKRKVVCLSWRISFNNGSFLPLGGRDELPSHKVTFQWHGMAQGWEFPSAAKWGGWCPWDCSCDSQQLSSRCISPSKQQGTLSQWKDLCWSGFLPAVRTVEEAALRGTPLAN